MKQAFMALVIFLLLVSLYSLFSDMSKSIEEVSLSELTQEISTGNISAIVVTGDKLEVTYLDGGERVSKKEAGTALTTTLKNYDVNKEALSKVNIEVKNDQGFLYWFASLAPIFLPIAFIVFFLWFLSRQVKGAGMQAFSFGQSKARLTTPDDKSQQVTFKDVAGCKEAKEELREIVDFLKNPKKFLDIGARIPKGILLMGAPGTGKTLLARAVAGEAGVSFFSISGSEFVEMFVGVGASRVRDLFDLAKKAAPAIIFVDEIDAVGRVRGTGVGGGNDEREQTLNQILVELDGFEPNEKVIVMAATNRPDVLDPALLRPGRFDRRVTLDLPDRKDREDILLIHARKKPFAEDVRIALIAERTPGFSGADLYSLMNEAAILAARESRTKVSQFDLIRSIEKVMLGPERKSHILSKREKELTAFHEAGHAVVASVLAYADPVHKISIISRGRVAGYVLKLPLEDRKLQSKKEFLDDIAVALGGYVVEKTIFEDLTTGPSNDLQVATALARDMVTKYGMSEKMGPMALESASGKPIFGLGVGDKEYSERVGAMIDAEVSKIMNDAMKKVEKIIKDHRKILDTIARRLVEVETIEQKEFEEILVAHGITPKKKKDIEHQV
ncbi:MAG: cell division protein FtsH [Candidatus Zambryskibacteria bacterium RIFCSPHIGHO2_02_FULL_43_14]|uniref:ATP-dependent zinc metalloprotease FtsH n=1 Tax=Candidatus Zambryskibacteria bacterium RIFCSPHIGHO2_02_FULL_43_14 TaxID=1802748 RepID=A0A1G2TG59_9BACT|nr:MAG: cell division protein FtsH [Candidatus Zambryskibacteria bacterium RIFCSPHIGHO2_01_FULL_43_60]OHA96028.1 MAG: cell division protein FtsH [Candidatus Zambryskibacteria bacterium RIFCSPHIGHO2_02_FULL_43_14]OHB03163.1 MAG: cell division protein FtsH [Candidatus Zambryskibacteria bacterium RIFCSPLOWO2_01_FULL_42_41]